LERVPDDVAGDLRACPGAGRAAFPEMNAGIDAGALRSATAADRDWKVRVIVFEGSGTIGAGKGTAGATNVRVNAMSSLPKKSRSTSALAPASVGSAQG
jgi:hypothetical protein